MTSLKFSEELVRDSSRRLLLFIDNRGGKNYFVGSLITDEHRSTRMKTQKASAVKIVAERRRKLASYEVAGILNQNKLIPQGTKEFFPASLQGAMICGRCSSHFVAG